MKSYNFTADAVAHISGYVEAENEEEARRAIRQAYWDEVLDETIDEPVNNIKITGYDEIDEEE